MARLSAKTGKAKKKKASSSSVMAKWGHKKWKVNTSVINPVDPISLTLAYDKDKKKKAKKSTKVPYTVYRELGVDVSKEIKEWNKLLGKKYPLYFGTKRFGPAKMQLVSADVSDITLTESGMIRKATFSLSFEEP